MVSDFFSAENFFIHITQKKRRRVNAWAQTMGVDLSNIIDELLPWRDLMWHLTNKDVIFVIKMCKVLFIVLRNYGIRA